MPTWPQASLSAGFTHVQDTQPNGPEEGATWYDLGSNEAKVYDGAEWHLLTVTSHAELSDVSAGQHRTDSNIRTVVDGAVDADTVDGQHASDLGASNTQDTSTKEWVSVGKNGNPVAFVSGLKVTIYNDWGSSKNTTIDLIGGPSYTFSIGGDSTESFTEYFSTTAIGGISVNHGQPDYQNVNSLDLQVAMPGHSHSI